MVALKSWLYELRRPPARGGVGHRYRQSTDIGSVRGLLVQTCASQFFRLRCSRSNVVGPCHTVILGRL